MKALRIPAELELYRVRRGEWGSGMYDDYGSFIMPGPCGTELRIIASPGDANREIPWEHVSVSTPRRAPNWQEMCFVKSLFWDHDIVVMQLHVAKQDWINNHPYCLHLWRPLEGEIPLPPAIAVGSKDLNLKESE